MRYSEMTKAQKYRFNQSVQTPGDFAIGAENVLGDMFAEEDAKAEAKIASWKAKQAQAAWAATVVEPVQMDLFAVAEVTMTDEEMQAEAEYWDDHGDYGWGSVLHRREED